MLIVGGACPALATPNNEANKKRLEGTVRFLQNAQNSDGGFSAGGNVGEPSDPEFSAWAAIGLASAGINPENQTRPGGESAYGYLAEHAGELASTTEFERVLLVVDAAGTSPQDFGGVDLTRAILQRQLPEGGFFGEESDRTPMVNATVFAILALSPIAQAPVQEAVASAAKWLEREQNADGSWPSGCPRQVPGCAAEPAGEVDMTAAVVEALNAAGIHDSEAQREALEYLHRAQNPDGGFPESPGMQEESDTASTSWAVQAIWSAGENPETWTQHSSGKEPLGFLESMQREDGSIQWEASSDANPVWMTAYAAPAFSGEWLPLAAVPLVVPSSTPPAGEGGVTAGGGGDGAPLFSRPQPQSQGHAPGATRQLKRARGRATRKPSGRDPELGHRQPALAIASSTAPTTASAKHARPNPGRRGRGTGGAPSTPTVTGLLIDASDDTPIESASEPGAPGLRSAAPEGNPSRWLAIGLGGLIALLILAGALLERRRPQVIL
jgi:prenyltransferase beta subunit